MCGVEYVEFAADADCVGLLNMDKVKIDPALALRVPPHVALRRQVLPFALSDGHVHVACANMLDVGALQMVEKVSGDAGASGGGRAGVAETGPRSHLCRSSSGHGRCRGEARSVDMRMLGRDPGRRCDDARRGNAARGHVAPGLGHPHRSRSGGRANPLSRGRRPGTLSPAADGGAKRRHQPLQGAVRHGHCRKAGAAGRRLQASLRPHRADHRHPRRHPADQVRRAHDAAAAGLANRVADARAAGHAPKAISRPSTALSISRTA